MEHSLYMSPEIFDFSWVLLQLSSTVRDDSNEFRGARDKLVLLPSGTGRVAETAQFCRGTICL